MKQHCVVIHTCIYQIGPFKFRLLVRTRHNWWVIFAGWHTSITNQEVPVLSTTANFIDQLSRILTNNLNLKAPVWWIYVCMMTQFCFTHLHLCFKKIAIFFWTLWEKNSFLNIFLFLWTNSLYTTSKLTPYRKIFSVIYIYISFTISLKCPLLPYIYGH